MFCKKCGFKMDDNVTTCPFCNFDNTKEFNVKKQAYVPLGKEYVKEVKESYVDLHTSPIYHILLAIIGYFGLEILFTIVGRIIVSYYQGQGYDFSLVGTENCPPDIALLYNKITCYTQTFCELFIVLVVAIIFARYLKTFVKQLFDKKTWKWYFKCLGLTFVLTFAYGLILQMFDISSPTSTNQAAVEDAITSVPSMGFLFVVIAAPLFEELIYRFGVFRAFTFKGKANEIFGFILTVLLFAGTHMVASFVEVFATEIPDWSILLTDLISFPSYLIGAFTLTLAYYKSKNLACSMLTHMSWNLFSFILIMLSTLIA